VLIAGSSHRAAGARRLALLRRRLSIVAAETQQCPALTPLRPTVYPAGIINWKKGGIAMAWKSPKVVEIAVGGEINSYVCARLK
jgi:coenzyme PQQ precursor peptide PqqA